MTNTENLLKLWAEPDDRQHDQGGRRRLLAIDRDQGWRGSDRPGDDSLRRMVLQPYRTFREIKPVASDFLLRMKAVKDGLPQIALIAVDGGRWTTDTTWAVRDWLAANLPAGTTIIA